MARKYAVPGSREFAWWYAQKRRRDRKAEEPGPTPGPENVLGWEDKQMQWSDESIVWETPE